MGETTTGPYAPAILRFQISFPDTYPSLPPLVTFSTDMFHPLITPLTTYMYTTDIQDNGTVSATDDERLPPGGFSLRHGFPAWFGRGSRSRQTSGQHGSASAASGSGSAVAQTPPRPTAAGGGGGGDVPGGGGSAGTPTPQSVGTVGTASSTVSSTPSYAQTRRRDVSTWEVLRYIRGTFDDENVLDSIPLEAAGNPGAWHAWRTYRRQQQGKDRPAGSTGPGTPTPAGKRGVTTPTPAGPGDAASAQGVRRPGEWNWEGVWEERSKRGITASLSEAVLYGNAGVADDVINFLSMDEAEIQGTKANLLRTLGASA